jgi:hypothetical protein
MKTPSTILRLAAVVSSILLAGGFVSYRAGVFDNLLKVRVAPVEEGAPIAQVPLPESVTKDTPYLIDGTSKSGAIFRGQVLTPAPQPEATPPKKPTLMSGSKSVAPLLGPGSGRAPRQQSQSAQPLQGPPAPPSK